MEPRSFFGELKRRNVYKVAITYSVVAWLLFELVAILLPIWEAPHGVITGFGILLVIGLIIAIMISWAFEATPEGLKRTGNLPSDVVLPTWSPRKYATFVICVALLAAGLRAYELLRPPPTASPSETTGP